MTVQYKTPKTIDEQIKYIADNKRVVFNNISEDAAKNILQKYGYINIITPFKYKFAKRNPDGTIVKKNGFHVYERDIDFSEYFDAFNKEREKYTKIFSNISSFESTFNSIVAYECIHFYNIKDYANFDAFINELRVNILKNYSGAIREHMLRSVSKFYAKMNEYDSIYIFMDRLNLNEVATVFRNIDPSLQEKIFQKLSSLGLTFDNTRMKSFDKALTKVIQIRNCVFHENSLTVLIRYYNVKEKKYRDKPSRSEYNRLVTKLSQ